MTGVLGSILAGILRGVPDVVDGERLELVIVGASVAAAVAAVVVLRTVHRASRRLALLGLLFLCGVGLWAQWERLDGCRAQCSCRVLGLDVDMDPPGLACERSD